MINFKSKTIKLLKEKKLSYDDIKKLKYNSDNSIEAYFKAIGYCQSFIDETVTPTVKSLLSTSNLEKAIQGIFFRMYCLNTSILKLNQVRDFQTVTSITRTFFELYVDAELLIDNLIKNGVHKYFEFTRVQKLKSARKVVRFYKDKTISFDHSKHEKFIINEESDIESSIKKLWGNTKSGDLMKPTHWSGLNASERVKKIDTKNKAHDLMEIYTQIYAHYSWFIHSDPTAIHGFKDQYFKNLTALCFSYFFKLNLKALVKICKFFKIDKTYNDFDTIINNIKHSPDYFILESHVKNI
jgi:uncharacterized protein DUF5677